MAAPTTLMKDLLVEADVGFYIAVEAPNESTVPIVISKLPDQPNTVIALFDSGGLASDPKWLLDFPDVSVLVRATEYDAAYDLAKAVKDTLLGVFSRTMGSDRLVSVTQIGNNAFTGRDSKDRPIFSLTFRIIIEPGTSDLTNREPL
jgi:hypothetical protein